MQCPVSKCWWTHIIIVTSLVPQLNIYLHCETVPNDQTPYNPYSHSIIAKMLLVTCYFSIFITIFAGRYLLIILGDNGPVGLNATIG